MKRFIKQNTIYVQIRRNNVSVRNVENNNEVSENAINPFTTKRLLIGNFIEAEKLLKTVIKKVQTTGLFMPKPVVVMHPKDMIEGGLSAVEDRVLRELAAGAGARKTLIWIGDNLSNDDILLKVYGES